MLKEMGIHGLPVTLGSVRWGEHLESMEEKAFPPSDTSDNSLSDTHASASNVDMTLLSTRLTHSELWDFRWPF